MGSQINQQRIREMALCLAGSLHARQVWLFGSRAWGKPRMDSDVDLLVVLDTSDLPMHKRCQLAYRSLRDFAVPKDLLVFTHAEFEEHAREKTSLAAQILKKGVLLFNGDLEPQRGTTLVAQS